MEIKFNELSTSDLHVDAIYKGGTQFKNINDEPFHYLIPNCENIGGFRKTLRKDGTRKFGYIVLYTTMEELEWPDFLDEETGIFRYYGDNREPGRALTDTKKGGNKLLEDVFSTLHEGKNLNDIPPILVFKKTGVGRDIQFLGLAAPGNPNIPPDKDLVAFWRTIGDKRFQNYEAYFTILDTKGEIISRKWIESLLYDHDNNLQYAPSAWKKFVKEGRNGIKALKAKRMNKIPTKYEQLQSDEEGKNCLDIIRNHYKSNPYNFEACATDIIEKMDSNFIDFNLTRPWRDGGRDAIGFYSISTGGKVNQPLKIDCALEAKCYSEKNAVKVKQMSRLISRIKYRQFGIIITTSYVESQAYCEVIEDGHPILIVTASDIAAILRRNSINTKNINEWLENIDKNNPYFQSA